MEHMKKIIGITGGVGAGKSSVLAVLKENFGAKIILADLVAHELMEPGSEGLKKVTEASEPHSSIRTDPWTGRHWRM